MPDRESNPPGGKPPRRGSARAGSRRTGPPAGPARPRRQKAPDAERGLLRAHDPFELIRWLALSQPDPRKALAELVQNSLDASARKIRITRLREKGVACLKIVDDGEGVIPEMDRPNALRYIATHVGHSRKRDLSPQQRLALMTQGQYGIGLLGFWSLGEMLEMRSVVPGQRPYCLKLHRDRPKFEIQPLRGRLPLDERWTEVVVAGLHDEAMGALIGRRAADYLAAELRGQLLSREVELLVEDRMARGRAPKLIAVRPPRFLGERLEGIGPVQVPGHPPARLEVYLAAPSGGEGDEPRGLAVYSAGTLVAEGFHELAALGLDHAPWTDARLTGFVDFPAFQVAPGSRRGIVPDEAAGAFARAILTLEPILNGLLESLDLRRTQELDRTLIKDLQRAFRDFYRQRPRYQMLPVNPDRDPRTGPAGLERLADGRRGDDAEEDDERGGDERGSENGRKGSLDGDGDEDRDGAGDSIQDAASGTGADPEQAEQQDERPRTPPPDLLPPGPLDTVRIIPSRIRVHCRGKRRVRAEGLDAVGRPVDEPVTCTWELIGAVGKIVEEQKGASHLAGGLATDHRPTSHPAADHLPAGHLVAGQLATDPGAADPSAMGPLAAGQLASDPFGTDRSATDHLPTDDLAARHPTADGLTAGDDLAADPSAMDPSARGPSATGPLAAGHSAGAHSAGAHSATDPLATCQIILEGADEPAEGRLRVVARSGAREASAEAEVEVAEEFASIRSAEGIPQPEFVHDTGAAWRSRMQDSHWQVNAGHREYRVIAERPVLKLRYLAMLFAKEVVLRSSQDPRLEKPLEQLVEVAAYADRNLSDQRGRRAAKRRQDNEA